jgi:hypothetical protein
MSDRSPRQPRPDRARNGHGPAVCYSRFLLAVRLLPLLGYEPHDAGF